MTLLENDVTALQDEVEEVETDNTPGRKIKHH